MMRKLFLIALLITALAIPSLCMAADNAHAIAVSGDIGEVVAIADGSTGNCTEVDSNGNLAVEIKKDGNDVADSDNALLVKQYASKYAYTKADGISVTGACKIYTILVTGTVAGDYALIYDALSATGDPEFDVKVGTAADTRIIPIPSGVNFSTGVYVDHKDLSQAVTIIYDN